MIKKWIHQKDVLKNDGFYSVPILVYLQKQKSKFKSNDNTFLNRERNIIL